MGRAAAQIEMDFMAFNEAQKSAKDEAEQSHMEEILVPEQLMSAVGPNGSDLPKEWPS